MFAALAPRRALVASDPGRALDATAVLARAKKASRVVRDGIATAGLSGDALVARAKALKDAGAKCLDAVAVARPARRRRLASARRRHPAR